MVSLRPAGVQMPNGAPVSGRPVAISVEKNWSGAPRLEKVWKGSLEPRVEELRKARSLLQDLVSEVLADFVAIATDDVSAATAELRVCGPRLALP